RHTRCLSDWSSDVCSSDLAKIPSGNFKVGHFPVYLLTRIASGGRALRPAARTIFAQDRAEREMKFEGTRNACYGSQWWTSWKRVPPKRAAPGMVRTQAYTMRRVMPQRTAESRRVVPTPTMAPVTV